MGIVEVRVEITISTAKLHEIIQSSAKADEFFMEKDRTQITEMDVAGIICPEFFSVIISVSQVLKPTSVPIEPKKLIVAFVATTIIAVRMNSSVLMN